MQRNAAALVGVAALAISAAASAAPQSTDKPDNHVVQAKDAVVKGAKVVGEKTKDGVSKTGEVMTDGWITTRVNARFVNEDLLKGSDINVDTDNHVVTLKGTVTQFQWTNPHAYIEIDVPAEGSNPARHWTVELGSPSILMQGGWKFSDVKPNQTITVVLNPLRNGQPAGLLVRITLADGRVLANGPGPTGGN